MNFVIKTARLAFFLTLLYLIGRGLMAGIIITHRQIPQTLWLSLVFVTQISYTLIVVWLISVVYHLKVKAVTIGLTVYLVLTNVNIIWSFMYSNGFISSSQVYVQTSAVMAILMYIVLLFMVGTSFRIVPVIVGVWCRIFFISIIVTSLLKSGLIPLFIALVPDISFEIIPYLNLLPLLPAIALLLTVQKTTMALEAK